MTYTFRTDLFVAGDGVAMSFNLRNCRKTEELKDYIEVGGGFVETECGPFTISLHDKDKCPKTEQKHLALFHSTFVIDCCARNKILPLSQFKCHSASPFPIEFNSNDVLMRKISWKSAQQQYLQPSSGADDTIEFDSSAETLSPQHRQRNITMATGPRSRQHKPRCEYTAEERKAIIKYIVDRKAYALVKGNTMWKEMEKEINNHTWQSLREHFLKKIIPLLHSYNLSPEIMHSLRTSAMSKVSQKRMGLNRFQKQSITNGFEANNPNNKKRKLFTLTQKGDKPNESKILKVNRELSNTSKFSQFGKENSEKTSQSNVNAPVSSKNYVGTSSEMSRDGDDDLEETPEKSCIDNPPPSLEDTSSSDAAIPAEKGNCNSTVQNLVLPQWPSNFPPEPVVFVEDIDSQSDLDSDQHDDGLTENGVEDLAKNSDEDVTIITDDDLAMNAIEDAATNANEDVSANTDTDISTNTDEDIAMNAKEDIVMNANEECTTNSEEDIATNLEEDIATNAGEDIATNANGGSDTDSEWSDDGLFWRGECTRPPNKKPPRHEYALYKPRPILVRDRQAVQLGIKREDKVTRAPTPLKRINASQIETSPGTEAGLQCNGNISYSSPVSTNGSCGTSDSEEGTQNTQTFRFTSRLRKKVAQRKSCSERDHDKPCSTKKSSRLANECEATTCPNIEQRHNKLQGATSSQGNTQFNDVAVQYNLSKETRDVASQTDPVLILPPGVLDQFASSYLFSKFKQHQLS